MNNCKKRGCDRCASSPGRSDGYCFEHRLESLLKAQKQRQVEDVDDSVSNRTCACEDE